MTLPPEFLLPVHGRSTLAELVPAIASHLTGEGEDPFGLPEAQRYVLLLVDGMGAELLESHAGLAPHLTSMDGLGGVTCAVPSTTATSLSCLGTGAQPGRHGILGYTFRSPLGGVVMNALTWRGGDAPSVLQPHPTAFEQLAAHRVAVTSVGPERFKRSGLTMASLRGPEFVPVADEDDIDLRADLARSATGRGDRSLTYVYERSLDHVGHGEGCESPAWRRRLGWVDELVEALSEGLDPGTVLIVTADHGMVDIPRDRRVLVEDDPSLLADVDDIGGEPRFRQIYTDRPEQVAERWSRVLGDRAAVLTADQAIGAGLFGDWDPGLRRRLGDVVVPMRRDWAVMTEREPNEMGLVGMHGSLTSVEMAVPLRWETVGQPRW
ncbi:alkaline phosphatase family protein [Acidipropionibacterium virtanenii]